jgi:hypothetical protein
MIEESFINWYNLLLHPHAQGETLLFEEKFTNVQYWPILFFYGVLRICAERSDLCGGERSVICVAWKGVICVAWKGVICVKRQNPENRHFCLFTNLNTKNLFLLVDENLFLLVDERPSHMRFFCILIQRQLFWIGGTQVTTIVWLRTMRMRYPFWCRFLFAWPAFHESV